MTVGEPTSGRLSAIGFWLVASGVPRRRAVTMTDEDLEKVARLPGWVLDDRGMYIDSVNDSPHMDDRTREARLRRFFHEVGVRIRFR